MIADLKTTTRRIIIDSERLELLSYLALEHKLALEDAKESGNLEQESDLNYAIELERDIDELITLNLEVQVIIDNNEQKEQQ